MIAFHLADLRQVNWLQLGEHVIAGASTTVIVLALGIRVVRGVEDSLKSSYPGSRLIGWCENGAHFLEFVTDVVEKLALNFRGAIAPKKRDVWSDEERKAQEDKK